MIVWAGISSETVGMVIEHYPNVIIPSKNQEVQNVPGRNGDILIGNGSFNNYEQPYRAFLDSKEIGGLSVVMPRLVDWLLGHDGYQRLEDTYFPDVYRMAYYSGGTEFMNIFGEYGEGNLTFMRAPEKYFKMGAYPIVLTKGKTLFNPSSFDALPIIDIQGDGSNGALMLNDSRFDIKTVPANMTIDSKAHKAFNGSTNYSHLLIGRYEDLVLKKETTITWSGGITSVSITPRWWTV